MLIPGSKKGNLQKKKKKITLVPVYLQPSFLLNHINIYNSSKFNLNMFQASKILILMSLTNTPHSVFNILNLLQKQKW